MKTKNTKQALLIFISIFTFGCTPPSIMLYNSGAQASHKVQPIKKTTEGYRRIVTVDSIEIREKMNASNFDRAFFSPSGNKFTGDFSTLDSSEEKSLVILKDHRFSKNEKDFIFTQAFAWTAIFSIVELGLSAKTKQRKGRAYNWRMPLIGLGLGFSISIPLTFGREKDEVYLDKNLLFE